MPRISYVHHTGRHHAPSAFNIAVSKNYHMIKASHPGMNHRDIFKMASKQASTHHTSTGSGMNLYTPHGYGVRHHRIGYY